MDIRPAYVSQTSAATPFKCQERGIVSMKTRKKNLSSIIKQACRYQDSNKSRIGTRISAILHLMIRSFSKVLGNAKLTVLTQALVGAASMGVISAFLLFDVSRPHSTIKEKQIGSEYQIKLIVQPCPYQDPNESRIGTKFKP